MHYLKNSHLIKPNRWGSDLDVKNAVQHYYENTLVVAAPWHLHVFGYGTQNLGIGYGVQSTTGTTRSSRGYFFDGDDDKTVISPVPSIYGTTPYALGAVFTTANIPSAAAAVDILGFVSGTSDSAIADKRLIFFDTYTPYISLQHYSGANTYCTVPLDISNRVASAAGCYDGSYLNLTVNGQAASPVSGASGSYNLGTASIQICNKSVIRLSAFFELFWVDTQKYSLSVLSTLSANPYAAIQPRSVPVYFFPASGVGAYTLAADGGTYEVSGTAASLLKNSVFDAGSGSYSATGTASSLLLNRTVSAGAGSYSVTGTASSLLKNSVISAGGGSYSVTGTEISLLLNRVLSAGPGIFSITGADVDLVYSGTVGPTYTLSAASGSFAIGGTDVSLLLNRVLAAGIGEYAIAGQAVSLLCDRVISALTGSYATTGTDVDLIYSGDVPPTYTLSASSGGFSITGTAADLLLNRILSAGGGSVSLSGSDAALLLGRVMSAGNGAYSVTGSDADLFKNSILSAGSGSYAIDGQAVTLTWSGVVLPTGLLSITFTASAPTVSFSASAPTITFN